MAGQAGHFRVHASEQIPYAVDRYTREVARLYGVLNQRLATREFVVGEYSIVDMACYPWIQPYAAHGQSLQAYPHLQRWFEQVRTRPAVVHAYAGVSDPYERGPALSNDARRILFGSAPVPA